MQKHKDAYQRSVVKYIWLIIIAQFLDLLTTIIGVGFLGYTEVNPFMRQFSLFHMSIIKVVAASIVVTTIYFVKRLPFWSVKLVLYISAFPVAWNTFMIILDLLCRNIL